MAKKKVTKKQQAPNQLNTGTWKKNFHIHGFGYVKAGENATEAQIEAWRKFSPLSVDNYLN